ncbi:MAG: transposase [Tunicatimonas sp.]|uniref:REP-associated tyrosine transposase n=1 Tax=Tunicatimonas sp. TaxID=1940096 RepID=UPI003C73AE4A
MSEKYKFHDPEGIYFITMTVVYWIDLFTRTEFKHLYLDSLRHCQREKGLIIHAWVLMPSHAHLIVSSKQQTLSAILRDLKKYTSKQTVKLLPNINESRRDWLIRAFAQAGSNLKRVTHSKVWRDGNHPILLDTNHLLEQRLNYIHQNPVKAEIVDEAEYYWYSSARDYNGQKGLLNVGLL